MTHDEATADIETHHSTKMDRALWISKKNELCSKIMAISKINGGDDIEWLRWYCKEVINTYKDDIQTALDCFDDVYNLSKHLEVKKGK